MVWRNLLSRGLPAALLLVAGGASANLFCCHDANGKKVCGNSLPGQCYSRAYYELDARGAVVRQVEAPLTPEQRAQRAVEEAKKKEEEKRLAEEQRRNQALVASYTSEKDIDIARGRALVDFDKTSQDIRKRHDEALKNKKKLDNEKEFFQKKPMPESLKTQIRENEEEIRKTLALLDNNTAERNALIAKYEEEKKRWVEFKYGKGRASSATGH